MYRDSFLSIGPINIPHASLSALMRIARGSNASANNPRDRGGDTPVASLDPAGRIPTGYVHADPGLGVGNLIFS